MATQSERVATQAAQILFVRGDLAFARIDDLMILCHGDLSDESWDAWIEYSIANSYRALIISARGEGPSPRHRRRLAERRAQAKVGAETVALLSDSPVLRGIMTAVAWITGNSVKAFSPKQVQAAIEWLGVRASAADVSAAIDALHASIDRASEVA